MTFRQLAGKLIKAAAFCYVSLLIVLFQEATVPYSILSPTADASKSKLRMAGTHQHSGDPSEGSKGKPGGTYRDWVCLVMFFMVKPSFPMMAPTNWVGTRIRSGKSICLA